MCVFTIAATSSLSAQTSNKNSTTKTQQTIKRYSNNSSATKYTNSKKQRVNKVQSKSTASKKSKIVPKAKKD